MPVAEGRPDANDLQIAEQFGKDCLKKLKNSEASADFFIKGNVPYRYVAPSTRPLLYVQKNVLPVASALKFAPHTPFTLIKKER